MLRASWLTTVLGVSVVSGMTSHMSKVLLDLAQCGRGYFGYDEHKCNNCSNRNWVPRSCGNRHCPGCGHRKSKDWVKARESELLPTSYFHVVFTVPGKLRSVIMENKRELYSIHFDAVHKTLKTFAADPRFLGAIPSILTVLHTWNQRLDFHPHIHCVLSGGGWDPETGRWIPGKNPNYLFPARAMRIVYRRNYLVALKKLYRKGELRLEYSDNIHLNDPGQWQRLMDELYETSWIVFAKKPFAGPLQVLRYLARYTHRSAIANSRILSLVDGVVTFRYKNRKSNETLRRSMPVDSFVRLFSNHILPKGLVRIRRCGLLSPGYADRLRLCQEQLRAESPLDVPKQSDSAVMAPEHIPESICPVCKKGKMVFLGGLIPVSRVLSLQELAQPPPEYGTGSSYFRELG